MWPSPPANTGPPFSIRSSLAAPSCECPAAHRGAAQVAGTLGHHQRERREAAVPCAALAPFSGRVLFLAVFGSAALVPGLSVPQAGKPAVIPFRALLQFEPGVVPPITNVRPGQKSHRLAVEFWC